MSKSKKVVKPASVKAQGKIGNDLELRNRGDREWMVAHERSIGAIDPERVQEAVELIEAARAAYVSECAKLKPDSVMPQRLVSIAHLAQVAGDSLSAIDKTFRETALALRRKGTFEAGPCLVSFDLQSGRRTPAWKEIAIEKASALARLKGKTFDPKRYVARVMAETNPSPDSYRPFIEVRY